MLYLATITLASALAAAPSVSPAPSPASSTLSAGASHSTTALRGMASPAPAAKPRASLELPAWTHALTIEQQQAAMRAELDAEFNIDHSP